jgi:DNA-binding NtrC family response regulator
VPPLRERKEDTQLLVDHFLARNNARLGTDIRGVDPEARRLLLEYPWPGNVRELQHVVERVVVLAHDVEADLDALPDSVRLATPPEGPSFSGEVMPIRRLQSSYAQWALARMGGHKGRTAERLDVDLKTLARWLARDDDDR